jgi:hypothetical protein
MPKYQSDQRDIEFNLNELLNVTRHEKYGFDTSAVNEILGEYSKFVENEIFPIREEMDEKGVTLTDDGVKVAECALSSNKAFYEMGWYALGLPEEIGGTPVSHALSTACASLGIGANTAWSMYHGLTRSAMNVIYKKGDDYTRKNYVEPMMQGRFGGTMCLTEAGAGSDVGNLKSTAKPIDGKDNWYSIKGTKIFISSGDSDFYENNIHLVLARTPEGGPGTKGISLFLVPKIKVNDDGSLGDKNDVVVSKVEHKMGIHGSATCVINFGDNGNCEGYLLGKEFDGMANMFIMMNEARLDCGVQGESQANLSYMLTAQYVKERSQFGTEIINHPDVKRMLLRMRAMSRGMRALTLYTADLFDEAENDSRYEDVIGLLTPICKSFCSEQGLNVCIDGVQAHGGYGYCSEYGVEQFVRDGVIAKIYEGTNGIQAIDFVMRKILKDGGKSLSFLSEVMMKDIMAIDEGKFGVEKKLLLTTATQAKEAMDFIGAKAREKDFNAVLQNCSDILTLYGHILVAWRLSKSAVLALSKHDAANEADKAYYQSKVADFRVYTKQFLPHAIACAKTVLTTDDDLTAFDI